MKNGENMSENTKTTTGRIEMIDNKALHFLIVMSGYKRRSR